jgi:clan AA aspartic protease
VIVGEVKPSRDAMIRVVISGPTGNSVELDAVIDTGFTDFLTAPKEIVDSLGLRFRESMTYELADSQTHVFDLYEASVLWHGKLRGIVVSVAEGGPLVGMNLLMGSNLNIDVIDGGMVEIRPL